MARRAALWRRRSEPQRTCWRARAWTTSNINEVRGTEGIKEAVYHVGGMDVKVAVVSGLSNANEVLEKVSKGEADYHFIEIMCCPGGCVNGGGQPIQPASVRSFTDLKGLRAKALYEEDKNLPLRKSHESPLMKTGV